MVRQWWSIKNPLGIHWAESTNPSTYLVLKNFSFVQSWICQKPAGIQKQPWQVSAALSLTDHTVCTGRTVNVVVVFWHLLPWQQVLILEIYMLALPEFDMQQVPPIQKVKNSQILALPVWRFKKQQVPKNHIFDSPPCSMLYKQDQAFLKKSCM